MRVAVYSDSVYRRDNEGLYADETFVVFAAGLSDVTEHLILVGRLHPEPGRGPYRLPDAVELVALPYYPSLLEGNASTWASSPETSVQVGRGQITSGRPRDAATGWLQSMRRFWALLGRVDSVWLIGPHPLAVAFALQGMLRRKRVVLSVRQDLPAYVRRRHPGRRFMAMAALALEGSWRLLARRCPTVVVGGDLARRYASAKHLIDVPVSLVDEKDIVPEDVALAPRTGPQRILLSVGRLDPEKNPLMLAEVLARLRLRDDRWRLVVCGDGAMIEQLRERLRLLGVDRCSEICGFVPLASLREWYRRSDVLLHVSWTEGVPQVLFEAFAAGLPVVATDVGGVRATVGEAAMLIPPGDPAAATFAVLRLADDNQLRNQLVVNGLEVARHHVAKDQRRPIAAALSNGVAAAPPGPGGAHSEQAPSPRRSGPSTPIQSVGWAWSVLPAGCRRVHVEGDPVLASALQEAGMPVELGGPRSPEPGTALLVTQGAMGRRHRELPRPGASVVAIAVAGMTHQWWEGASASRWAKAAAVPVAMAASRVQARRVAGDLARQGWTPSVTAIGDGGGPYAIGRGSWRRLWRPATGALVVGRASAPEPSVLDQAVEKAACSMDVRLVRRAIVVQESGKILQELEGPDGQRFVQHVAVRPASDLIEQSTRARARLAQAGAATAVRDRTPWPVCEGEVGLARYMVEPWLPGRHPAQLTERLWEECLEFLVALHWAGRDETAADEGGCDIWAGGLERLAEGASREQRAQLRGIRRRLHYALEPVPLGWGHGDMWLKNLLIRRGRLRYVLDWDWSQARALPLLDLFELRALSSRRTRDAVPGDRLCDVLWPIVEDGGDRWIRAYCGEIGLDDRREILAACAVAYWVDRASRDLGPWAQSAGRSTAPFRRGHHPAWRDRNLDRPLAFLAAQGWAGASS